MSAYEWAVSLAWVLLLVVALYWEHRRMKREEYEADHEDALEIDRVVELVERQRHLLKVAEYVFPENDSEFQQRARRAEALGFMDDDSKASA